MRLLRLLFVALVVACTPGGIPVEVLDGGEDDVASAGFDIPATGLCGANRRPCCGGRACNRGLSCEQGGCCGSAGATCEDQLDCCGAFGCNKGRCCVDIGGVCETNADCCEGGLCR